MEWNQVGYQLLDHPADLGIEAWGPTLPEAFEQAAMGLMSVILDLKTVRNKEVREIRLQGHGYENLLVKWLEEILFLYDGQGFVGAGYKIEKLSHQQIIARVLGEPFSLSRHDTVTDVKAVTYHQLLVLEAPTRAMVRVFLDI